MKQETCTPESLAFALQIERCAVLGARNDLQVDKTDFLRIWALARSFRGESTTFLAWRNAYEMQEANQP